MLLFMLVAVSIENKYVLVVSWWLGVRGRMGLASEECKGKCGRRGKKSDDEYFSEVEMVIQNYE
jgi:hypothetical protein